MPIGLATQEKGVTGNHLKADNVQDFSLAALFEYFEALHRVVIGVFGQTLDPGFENDIITFEEKFMGAMETHNPRMTPKVHVLVHHVTGYERRTGVQLASQHRFFDISYQQFKFNCPNSPVYRERLLKSVLHYNSCYM